jgi:lysophospholipase L1-like esterase
MSAPALRRRLLANLPVVALSLAGSFLLLALLEGGLRSAGIGAPDASRASRLRYQQVHLPLLGAAVRDDGVEIWRPADPRLPYQSLLRRKPAGGLRILTLGGSATAGLGFSPNVSFARYLERMLAEHSPGRAVEVGNLGIVAFSSRQVKLLVADASQRYQPDLVVVYSGNNEFLEVHAEKFARARGGVSGALGDALRQTHLFRVVERLVRGAPKPPSLADRRFSNEDLRLTQEVIVREIEMSPAEVEAIVDAYERNIEEMVERARAHDAPILLMTVASNWRWRGREDLPEIGLSELLGEDVPEGEGGLRRARRELDARLAAAARDERSALLYQRALASESLGEFKAARRDYRAAMNEDPHLRRALDAMNDRVRAVAARTGAPLLDTVALLEASAEHGIVGFDAFYDYVHFTPRGALEVAAALVDELEALGLVDRSPHYSARGFAEQELARIAAATTDFLAIDRWLGVGFDLGRIADRDLWKYEKMVQQLDERLAADPRDVRALVYRANARYFELDGAAAAERDYRAALELAPESQVIRGNLVRLRQAGRS